MVVRLDERCALRGDHQGQPLPVLSGGPEQALALRCVGGVPAVRHLVPGQELPDARGAGRPAVPDDLAGPHGLVVAGPPGVQEVVDHRVELLLRRVPGLEQVVVEVDDVDRVDRRVRVRVRGQQHTTGSRKDIDRLFEELDAVHLRHPVVGEDHGHLVPAQLQLAQGVEGGVPGLGAHDAVLLAVAPPEVTGDGARHPGIVIDGQNDGPRWTGGLGHWSPTPRGQLRRRPTDAARHAGRTQPQSYVRSVTFAQERGGRRAARGRPPGATGAP